MKLSALPIRFDSNTKNQTFIQLWKPNSLLFFGYFYFSDWIWLNEIENRKVIHVKCSNLTLKMFRFKIGHVNLVFSHFITRMQNLWFFSASSFTQLRVSSRKAKALQFISRLLSEFFRISFGITYSKPY